jgi:hypothetical protein
MNVAFVAVAPFTAVEICLLVASTFGGALSKFAAQTLPRKIYQGTAILMTIEGRFQAFQGFSSSKLVLKTVESCFAALD